VLLLEPVIECGAFWISFVGLAMTFPF